MKEDDARLIQAYLEHKSETAFRDLVQRHIRLVYSVALRRVGGDVHLAEDVSQKVFADLARKASQLSDRSNLAGWLYLSAHAASAAVVRSEQRRKTRETEATSMHIASAADPEEKWKHLKPLLDEAIVQLNSADRDALVLRFFDQRNFAEVGRGLQVTEEAARKRVDRALEKLRLVLARRGVTSTASALGVVLATTGTVVLPVELGTRIAALAHANSAVSGVSAAISGLKIFAPIAAVVALGAYLVSEQRATQSSLQKEIAQLSSETRRLESIHHRNRELARIIADTDALRRRVAERSISRTAADETTETPPPRNAEVVLGKNGTLQWDGQGVSLREFLANLEKFDAAMPKGTLLKISADPNASAGAVHYLLDEVRKVNIQNLRINLPASAVPRSDWF
jgi:RNA polymerase sigma factor (sigma-70 family)